VINTEISNNPLNESCIYIHCGLHKTATTTLQQVLNNHEDMLRSSGILYPQAGRIRGGHHNIAWQLARDRRFRQSTGDLDALFSEIDEFKGRVVLSSEDFESSIAHPERWQTVSRFVQESGRKLIFIMYFRSQVSYLESLYREMLKHGYGEEFTGFAGDVLAHGRVKIKEWEFHFDYWRVVNKLSTIPCVSIVSRNFHSLLMDSPVLDFFAALDMHCPFSEDISKSRYNMGIDIKDSITLYYQNRIQRKLNPHEQEAITRFSGQITGRVGITGNLRKALENKFAIPNMQLCQLYRIPTIGLLPASHSQGIFEDDFSIQKVFSFEAQVALVRIMDLITSSSTDSLNIEHALREQLHAWSTWTIPSPIGVGDFRTWGQKGWPERVECGAHHNTRHPI